MELTLARQAGSQVLVTCDNQPSHAFDLLTLIPHEKGLPQPLDDPVAYGQAIYAALFPPQTLAQRALANAPERILLITTDNGLDAVPWEYAYGPDGFLILECHFVRGLPAEQRMTPPTLDTGPHIVAVPSNPLDKNVPALNIDGEWRRLKEIIQNVPYAITLERTRPPTIEQVRTLVANQHHRVIHFMGHGGQDECGALLYFEQDNGDLDQVAATQFVLRVRGCVFLVTLNACVSATPGETLFNNLASALVQHKVPYALGMCFSIPDEDAHAFSRTFYNDLARGSSVEEALLQTRLTLATSSRPWAIGVPVLYTCLTYPAAGFPSRTGSPIIEEHQPRIEVSALPRAEGTFQGRIDELKALGTALTGDSRPPIVTIHGTGGQGKSTLAREAVERFAYAWPGGIWATSLENLQSRELFVSDLARFLGIDTKKVVDPNEIERLVIAHLVHRWTLIVLDNVETLVEAVEANNAEAIHLAQFLREQLPRPSVSLLATSRSFLGWAGEISCELTGLAPLESVRLFQQHAPQREKEIDQAGVWELSEKVEGHPFSLRLLGSAFNASSISFSAFVKDYEARLLSTENKYIRVDHRHRTLYASIETSVRYLSDDLRALLSGLWIFHAPFLAETAAAIFAPESGGTEDKPFPIREGLLILWRRGLLTRQMVTARKGVLEFFHLLPTTRPYVEHHLEQAHESEKLLARLGTVYSHLASVLDRELDRSAARVAVAQQTREDLVRGVEYVAGIQKGYYLWNCGWILHRLGNPGRVLALFERAMEIAQGQDQTLEFQVLNDMALVYQARGKPQEALALYEQVLPIRREVGDRAKEAVALNNMGEVYRVMGKPQEALKLYEQALPIMREVGNRAGEALALNNMALVYQATGKPQEALKLYGQALPIRREVGDRAGEATTLNNIAGVYHITGKPQEALMLFEQALPITQEVGERAMEANVLSNMGEVYRVTGKLQEAFTQHGQALLIRREIGDRSGEADALNGMALVYQATGRLQEALKLYGQALPILRKVGNRTEEATVLSNIAVVYQATGKPQEALMLFEQALSIMQEVGNRAGEAAMLANMAVLLYRYFNRTEKAITRMEQAIAVLVSTGLPQDVARQTINDLQRALQIMRTGASR